MQASLLPLELLCDGPDAARHNLATFCGRDAGPRPPVVAAHLDQQAELASGKGVADLQCSCPCYDGTTSDDSSMTHPLRFWLTRGHFSALSVR